MLQNEMLARQSAAGHWINSLPEVAGSNPVLVTFLLPEVGSGSEGGCEAHTLFIHPASTANPETNRG